MDRLRADATLVALAVASVVGFGAGATLGLMTEHGFPGLITLAGGVLGAGAGIWLVQTLAMPGRDDELDD